MVGSSFFSTIHTGSSVLSIILFKVTELYPLFLELKPGASFHVIFLFFRTRKILSPVTTIESYKITGSVKDCYFGSWRVFRLKHLSTPLLLDFNCYPTRFLYRLALALKSSIFVI